MGARLHQDIVISREHINRRIVVIDKVLYAQGLSLLMGLVEAEHEEVTTLRQPDSQESLPDIPRMLHPMIDIAPRISHDEGTRLRGTILLIAIDLSSIDTCQITACRESNQSIVLWINIQFLLMVEDMLNCSSQILHRCMVRAIKSCTILQHEGGIS